MAKEENYEDENKHPLQQRIAVAIWRLATNTEYRTIAHLFGISRASVCCIVNEFCCVVCEILMPELIKIPQGDEMERIVNGFENRWGYPQCGGAIDGSHIPIQGQLNFHTDYYNRKGWYSVIIQALVDHNYCFMDVNIGWPGSCHDARVFSNSSVYTKGNNGSLSLLDWKNK